MSSKSKQYKRFNFPNKLTGLEQYYFYLLEFGVIPEALEPKAIEVIFRTVVKDYLEGFITAGTFECVVSNLYFGFVVKQTNVSLEIEKLMAESADVTYYGQEAIHRLKEKLEIFNRSRE